MGKLFIKQGALATVDKLRSSFINLKVISICLQMHRYSSILPIRNVLYFQNCILSKTAYQLLFMKIDELYDSFIKYKNCQLTKLHCQRVS